MFNILGSIVKTILSPITRLVFMGAYSLLIKGPLTLLNLENSVLNLATSDYTTKLLFNTSITNGKPHFNFFTSNSPLQPFYMTMIGVAGTLVTIFLGFVLLSSLNSKRGEPKILKKMTHLSLSSVGVFSMPVAFLTVVSLSGSLITALSGQSKNLSNNDISKYKQYLINQIHKLRNGNYDSLSFNKTKTSDWNGELYSNDNPPVKPWVNTTTTTNETKSVNEIYDYLATKTNTTFETSTITRSEDIIQLATTAKDNFKTLNDMIVSNNNGITSLKQSLLTKINSAESIINRLTPNYKNEYDSDRVKNLMDDLISIQDAIANWRLSMASLFSYLPSNIDTPPMAALANMKTVYDKIWDQNNVNNNQVITSLSDLSNSIAHVVNGDPKTGLGGLLGLKHQITNFEDSSLTVTFYQLVTGNKDTNWDRSFASLKNGGAMLLIGLIMIVSAILMLATIILECFMRIMMLGLLFITGPIWIGTSVIDNGARMKTWINVCVGQTISIFGVILILRFGFILMDKLKEILENSNLALFQGNTGYLVQSLTLAFFAYAVMQGAIKSRQTLLQIAGSNQGLMNPGNPTNALRKIWSAGRAVASGGASVLGMQMASSISKGKTFGNSGGGRMAAFKQNWSRRAANIRKPIKTLSSAVTTATKGKYGTIANKQNYANQLENKLANKIFKKFKKSPQYKSDLKNQKSNEKNNISKKISNLKNTKKKLKGDS